jgi:predicted transglutaminase-like cysteine proteinase
MHVRLLLAAACFVHGFIAMPALAARTPLSEERDFAPQAALSMAPNRSLFGTRETFEGDAARFAQWKSMIVRSEAEFSHADHICASSRDRNCTPREWADLIAQVTPLPLREKIERVNAAMNRHPYVPTYVNWHQSMYWETPFEFLARGGQCQDYAIAKYLLLRQAGVPASAMRMVVVRARSLGLDHAVLAVYVDGEPMLLDNLRYDIIPASAAASYAPYYSINETGWWLHTGPGAVSAAWARR